MVQVKLKNHLNKQNQEDLIGARLLWILGSTEAKIIAAGYWPAARRER